MARNGGQRATLGLLPKRIRKTMASSPQERVWSLSRRVYQLIPVKTRRWLVWIRALPAIARAVADRPSFRAFVASGRPRDTVGPACSVALAELGGRSVMLRRGTTDWHVALATVQGGFHLPPPDVGDPSLIWDLGANIGLTVAHLACKFPDARIVGVELDGENASLARENVGPWADRCSIIEAAVWPEAGLIRYDRVTGIEDGPTLTPEGPFTARALSLNHLLDETGPPDYVKMDIEGSESAVLRTETDWTQSVRCLSVECHPPYSLDACGSDLARLGFGVTLFPQTRRRPARPTAIGIRH